jgi:hypothetical protein
MAPREGAGGVAAVRRTNAQDGASYFPNGAVYRRM